MSSVPKRGCQGTVVPLSTTRFPTARTVGRWLSRFTCRDLSGLHKLNEELVAEALVNATFGIDP